jgi:hypothetical protein
MANPSQQDGKTSPSGGISMARPAHDWTTTSRAHGRPIAGQAYGPKMARPAHCRPKARLEEPMASPLPTQPSPWKDWPSPWSAHVQASPFTIKPNICSSIVQVRSTQGRSLATPAHLITDPWPAQPTTRLAHGKPAQTMACPLSAKPVAGT